MENDQDNLKVEALRDLQEHDFHTDFHQIE